MIPIVVSRRASNDLHEIWEHIASDSENAAAHHDQLLFDSIQKLGDQPFLGPARPEFGDDCRVLIVGDYLIIYQVTTDRVLVHRVVHGARNIPGELGDFTDH